MSSSTAVPAVSLSSSHHPQMGSKLLRHLIAGWRYMENKFNASQLSSTPYQRLKFSIGAQCCEPAWSKCLESKQLANVEKGLDGHRARSLRFPLWADTRCASIFCQEICSVVETSHNIQHLKPHLLAFLDEGLRVEEIWILIVGDAWLKVSMVGGKLVDII